MGKPIYFKYYQLFNEFRCDLPTHPTKFLNLMALKHSSRSQQSLIERVELSASLDNNDLY